MDAVVLREFGPAANLAYEEWPDPQPGPGQVVVAVRAAGVHVLDATIRRGEAGGPFPLPGLPFVSGREVAGVVEQVGDGVGDSWLGRRVVAHLGQLSGGYASRALAPASALHHLPGDVDDAEAVAMIGTGRTVFAILDRAVPTAEDTVLVTAAAGGLGALLVQASLAVGATVIGAVGGPAKVALVEGLGAWAVDYDEPGWTTSLPGVSLVLESVGGDRGRAALELLEPDGRIVFSGWSSGAPTPISVFDLAGKGITATAAIGPRITRRPGGPRGFEEQALRALAEKRLTPLLTRFPLAAAAEAHEALETRRTTGKVVLVP